MQEHIAPHIVFGAGITRALFASFGVLAEAAENKVSFATIGGISAGAIVPALFAGGVPVETIEHILMEHGLQDFLLVKNPLLHWPKLLWRAANHRRYKRALVSQGLWETTLLATFIDDLVASEMLQEWPSNYWTMAAARDQGQVSQIIFTAGGVFKRSADQSVVKIDDRPAPLGLALRATCALPGFFDSVTYTTSAGVSYELFDGVCTWDGFCPAALVEGFYGARKDCIIACDVIKYKTANRLLKAGYLAVLLPDPPFAGCRFNPSDLKKRNAIAGARASCRSLFESPRSRLAANSCDQL